MKRLTRVLGFLSASTFTFACGDASHWEQETQANVQQALERDAGTCSLRTGCTEDPSASDEEEEDGRDTEDSGDTGDSEDGERAPGRWDDPEGGRAWTQSLTAKYR